MIFVAETNPLRKSLTGICSAVGERRGRRGPRLGAQPLRMVTMDASPAIPRRFELQPAYTTLETRARLLFKSGL